MKKSIWNKILICLLGCLVITNTYVAASDTNNYYPKREIWEPWKGTDYNISHYIYHDTNMNGIYDYEDRPLVDFVVKMTRPDGSNVIKRSNLNGFVNFTNSYIDSPVDVSEPGEYIFEAIVPNGWKITSNNQIQQVNYRIGNIERSSLIADKVPTPVGVIQIPSIEGKIKNYNTNINVLAISPNNNSHNIIPDNQGYFYIEKEINNEYGEWTIIVKDVENNIEIKRKTTLGVTPVKLSTIDLNDTTIPPKSNISLIDFENITNSTLQKMPNNIAGVNWTNFIVSDFLFYQGEGYINNRVSGKYIGYNTSGYPVYIYNEDGFDFYGGFFGAAWRIASEGEVLEVRVYRDNKLIDQQEFELSALGPFYFDADYRNITKIEFKTKHYWQFVTDDILLGVD